jgi:ABC-type uncharacterized transport system auxiliary subunit
VYRFRRFLIPAMLLSFSVTACSTLKQPSERIDYYTLEYATPRVEDLKPMPSTILVERFTVSPLYNSTQIVYRDMSFKRESYNYYKWRANPGDLVTYFLARDMRDSGLFKAVFPEASRMETQYVLGGSVDEFFESDTGEGWKSVLGLSTTLMIAGEPDISKKIIFQKTFRSTRPCKQENPMGVAEAMSEAMADVSGQIIRAIYEALKNRE